MFAGAYDADRPVEQLKHLGIGQRWLPLVRKSAGGKTHWRFWHFLVIDDTMYVARYRLRTRANLQRRTFPAEDWEVPGSVKRRLRKLAEISE